MSSIDDIAKLGKILGIWAHPDDESFMIGGILAQAIRNGQTVGCITATKGESGVQDELRWPAARLGEIRSAELAAALKVLGVTQHHWLGYADGHCSDVEDTTAVAELVKLIDRFKPDTIIAFAPDGLTGHEDHKAVSRWTNCAAIESVVRPTVWCAVHTQESYDASLQAVHDKFNIYFNIDVPKFVAESNCDIAFELPDDILAQKIAALQAMPSQYEAFFTGIPITEVELAVDREGLVRASRWEAL